MEQKYIVALEIGSSHIRAAVGTVNDDGALTLLAVEDEYAVEIVRYGTIQNVEEVSNRVKSLMRKLENYQSIHPRKIKGVYISIGGRSTTTTSRQVVRQYDVETAITAQIIAQINEEAKQCGLSDHSVIDVCPREFVVDNLECSNPVGTLGKSIRADINLITCKPKILRNFDIALSERQQLSIKGTYVRQNVIADLVVTTDEKKLGCMLVDFGAETTTVSVYKNGALHYLATLPIGSRNITRDIMATNLTEERADEVKRIVGDAINAEPKARQLHNFGADVVEVNSYIRARAGEIVLNIIEQAKYAGYSISTDLPGGIIIVGGGAKLRGFNDLLAEQSGVTVRLGAIPSTIRISDPRLQSFDMIDIVALLNAAAQNALECTEAAPAPQPAVDPFADENEGFKPQKGGEKVPRGKNDKTADDTTHQGGKTRGIWRGIQDTLAGLFVENDPDD